MPELEFPLYHGTSTLFLESIARFGLGGYDPVKELRVVECARQLLPIAESRLNDSLPLQVAWPNFQRMAAQSNSRMNFQHGHAYLSPALSTAVRYAVNKEKGSEIISYTLRVVDELVRLGEHAVKETLFQEFPSLFDLLDIQAAPVLLRLRSVETDSLLSENGDSAAFTLKFIREALDNSADNGAELCQQMNFRLIRPLSADKLSAYLISVRRYHVFTPDYCLLPISLNPFSFGTS